MKGNWLQSYLADAVRRKLCTKINCSTCGATEFRRGLIAALNGDAAQGAGENYRRPLEREEGIRLLKALAEVASDDGGGSSTAFEGAVRFLLYDLWASWVLRETDSENLLAGSWAGSILDRMKTHYEARMAAQRRREELNNPANVQKRREERKRLKQEQHELRLARKKERDRIWREQHQKSPD